MTRYAVYCRVSTDTQERDGTSLDTQEQACRDSIPPDGDLVELIRDTASGSTLDRPGAVRLRALLRDGTVDVVLAYSVDRLSRNQNHIGVLLEEAEQAGAKFEFASESFEDTAVGRFVLNARAFSAEVERDHIAERTSRGKAATARAGRLPQGTGKGLYGYTYDPVQKKRFIEEGQAAVVRRIFEDFVAGASTNSIATALNKESIPTLLGKRWFPATVVHLLEHETYTGRTVFRRTKAVKIRSKKTGRRVRKVYERDPSEWIEIPGFTPPIISIELFEAARTRRLDPERIRRGRRIHSYPLSGHIRCTCDAAMVGQTQNQTYRYYRCRRAFARTASERCDSRYVRADHLEPAIVSAGIAQFLQSPELVLAEMRRRREHPAETDEGGRRARNQAEITRAQGEVFRRYEAGHLSEDQLAHELRLLRRRESAGTNRSSDESEPTAEEVAARCRTIGLWLQACPPELLEAVAAGLQLRIKATSGRAEVEGILPDFVPESVHADVRSVVATNGIRFRFTFTL